VLHTFGNAGILDFAEDWLVLRAAPYLLDERILPNRAVPRSFRGMRTHALCNPHSLHHRSLFWFGRLDEKELDAFLRSALRAGDHFIDVGANFGQVAALAAALVGKTGSVTAFEPHPDLARLVEEHLRAQFGNMVKVHAKALGETRASVTLHVRADALGKSNIGRYKTLEDAIADGFTDSFIVQQVVGDDVLLSMPSTGSVILKIDVEGKELAVLRGMREPLEARVDVVIVEVTPEWIGGIRTQLWRHCSDSDIVQQANVLFAKRPFLVSRNLVQIKRSNSGTESVPDNLRVRR
jgi:FkbM family methyltransferase